MAASMFSVIQESVTQVIRYNGKIAKIDVVSISIIGGTVLLKIGLYLYCSMILWSRPNSNDSISLEAYATDHLNDALSNGGVCIAIVLMLVSAKYLWWTDPLVAVVIALYIMYSWAGVAYDQILKLTGKTAPPDILKIITWIAFTHAPEVIKVCCGLYVGSFIYLLFINIFRFLLGIIS